MATSITNTSITTDDLTVDTNTLKVDSTNNRVGINTTTPDAALQVQNGDITVGWADNFIGTQFQDGTNFRLGMKFGTVNRTTKIVAETNDSNGEITFETNGSEKMRIHPSGLVTTPNSLAVSSFLNTTHTHNGSGAQKVTNWTQATGTSGPTFPASRHHNSFDYTNSRFVAPVTGLYMMVYKPDYDRTLTTNHYISFGINGASRSFDVVEDQPQYNNSGTNYNAYLQLNANDYVELYTQGGVTYGLRGSAGYQWQTWWFIIQLA